MDLPESGMRGIDGISLTHGMDMWRAILSAVPKFRVPKNAGNFLD